MKYIVIPCAVIALLFGLAMWNARSVGSDIEPWCDALADARAAVENEDWDGARELLDGIREVWDDHKDYYHIVIEHDELDNAEALFERVYAAIDTQDDSSFRAETGALVAQLRVIAEMQELTIRNVL